MIVHATLGALCLSVAFAAPSLKHNAPYHHAPADGIEGEYIVTFHKQHTLEQHYEYIGKNLSTDFDRFYNIPLINAYHIQCDETTIHDLIRSDPGVRRVAQNVKVSRTETYVNDNSTSGPPPPKVQRNKLQKRWAYENVYPGEGQTTSQWWPMMISTEKVDSPPAPNEPYGIWRDAGKGVHLYVLDDGILLSHDAFVPDPDDLFNGIIGDTQPHAVNFQNKAISDYIFPPLAANPTPGGMDVQHGCHGTHVASLAGGIGYGTARWSTIVNVRVLDDNGEGSAAQWARAINDIVTEHQQYKQSGDPQWRGSVINMSLSSTLADEGSENLQAVKDAIDVALEAGIPIVVAAGNQGQNGDKLPATQQRYPCQWSKTTDLICVGNVESNYKSDGTSNRGSSISIWAPGHNIIGAFCRNTALPITMTGTSMASPFVAGVVAGYVGYEQLTNVSMVKQRLFENANKYVDSYLSTPLIVNTGLNKRLGAGPYLNAPDQPAPRQGYLSAHVPPAAGNNAGPPSDVDATQASPTTAAAGDDVVFLGGILGADIAIATASVAEQGNAGDPASPGIGNTVTESASSLPPVVAPAGPASGSASTASATSSPPAVAPAGPASTPILTDTSSLAPSPTAFISGADIESIPPPVTTLPDTTDNGNGYPPSATTSIAALNVAEHTSVSKSFTTLKASSVR